MKKIVIAFLLLMLTAPCLAASVQDKVKEVIARKNTAGAPACTTSNDSLIVATPNTTADSTVFQALWYAWPTGSISSGTQITGLTADIGDAGGSITAVCELWNDDTGAPGSIVGAGYTSSVSTLPDDNGSSVTDFMFAATQTISSTASYWVVCHEVASNNMKCGHKSTGSGTGKYSANAGVDWADAGEKLTMGGVWGCAP